jgi:hypothetical protein
MKSVIAIEGFACLEFLVLRPEFHALAMRYIINQTVFIGEAFTKPELK